MEQERTLALALCRVEGIGAVSIRKLLEKAGDVSEIRKLPAESLQKLLGEKKAALLKNWDAPENLEQAKRQAERSKHSTSPVSRSQAVSAWKRSANSRP